MIINEAYLGLIDIMVANICHSFTRKMAPKTSRHRYGTKLRHCHPMYSHRGNFTHSFLLSRCSGMAAASSTKCRFIGPRTVGRNFRCLQRGTANYDMIRDVILTCAQKLT